MVVSGLGRGSQGQAGLMINCVEAATLLNMESESQRHSVALNLRISPDFRKRLDHVASRYDSTITSVSRMALMIGLEALERLRAESPQLLPADPGTRGTAGSGESDDTT
ncbi:hypothetical protein Aph01nite_76830 [Acrocarpospora phusangensis]|uniref:Uncharacterized protein n=1 Tax=Acrocarpospora phusangensis TaxID=1070424 RepID=A0A919UT53_9ACTN|nr:hypothetical protein Aph01nite_76830 [Acrocarpospora phusangensis]